MKEYSFENYPADNRPAKKCSSKRKPRRKSKCAPKYRPSTSMILAEVRNLKVSTMSAVTNLTDAVNALDSKIDEAVTLIQNLPDGGTVDPQVQVEVDRIAATTAKLADAIASK